MILQFKGTCAPLLPLSKSRGKCHVTHPCSGVPDWHFRRIDHDGSHKPISVLFPQ